ncbi:hypothetical protein PILCRDRAFT_827823 [Piloderma croceum F 1598]|uniref:Uncharacterized protein n=1 Tax=Piloderma croceum (strain F 1598) TaxID=765440 RepID=A0A0C3EQN1_PILCF|nr:hypothetical protein PILCRDRAFT_827823 [Piloderma croceum F 1598]
MTISPAYVQPPPPLRWLRLPLLVATLGLSCVCVAVGGQALDRSSRLEKSLMAQAQSLGSVIIFDMNDIKATTAVLTTAASLLALSSLVFSVALIIDWIRYLYSPRPKLSAKEGGDEEASASPGRFPFSTHTLCFQTITLSFLTVWLLAILIPSTVFVRTRSAHVTIQTTMPMSLPSVDTKYWDYGFLRCLGAAPWFSLIFSFPASIITWVAWKSPNTVDKA